MKSLLLIFVSVILGVLGQLSMKQGMLEVGYIPLELAKFGSSFSRIITTPFVLLGLFLYAVSAMFWLVVLSRVELSYAYPMISIGYVLVVFLSWALFHEHISSSRILGVLLICSGVLLIVRS